MKSQLSIVEKRAISSKNLQNRLNLNKKLGSKDLTKWLFNRYKIKKKRYYFRTWVRNRKSCIKTF